MAVSPDENTVVTSGAEGKLKLYDLRSSSVRATLSGQLTGFGPLAFSPNGEGLAAGGGDGSIVGVASEGWLIWQAATWPEIAAGARLNSR